MSVAVRPETLSLKVMVMSVVSLELRELSPAEKVVMVGSAVSMVMDRTGEAGLSPVALV